MINSIYVWPNLTKEKYLAPVRAAVEALEKRGFACLLSQEDETRLYGVSGRRCGTPALADLILSVGGDGTFLRAAETAIAYRRPLCGYNAGRLGYLCALRSGELETADFNALCYSEEPLLSCVIDGVERYALSDIVIGKDYFGGTIVPAWRIGNGKEAHCIGDGLILSAPLGSTGYTRSAGGPLLADGCGRFALTPICPHSGSTQACTFPDTEPVLLRNADPTYSASVYGDGRLLGALTELEVKKAACTLKVVKRT